MASAEDGLDACEELADAEGLGDVVVGSELEAEDFVDLLALGGEHDDGDVHPLGSDSLADLEAVELGEHEVEDDEVGACGEGEVEAGLSVGCGEDLVALELEVVLEAHEHVGLVFNDQDLFHR